MLTSVRFDGAVGSSPLGSSWSALSTTLGTSGTTVAANAVIAQDATGKYLTAGYPIAAAGALLPDLLPFRVHVVCDLGTAGALVRFICPISGAAASPTYAVVEVKNNAGALLFSAWFTAPDVRPLGVACVHFPIARRASTLVPSASELLTFEAGPRFIRVFRSTGTEFTTLDLNELKAVDGSLRTPVFGAAFPDSEIETWGIFTQGGKIRSVTVGTEAADVMNTGSATAISSSVDPTSTGSGNQPRLLIDDSRPALLTYRVVPTLQSREHVAMVSGWGRSGNGRIPDSRSSRLDGEQTIILIPKNDTYTMTMAMGDIRSSGGKAPTLAVTPPVDASGPDVGIGSGRKVIVGNGELCLEAGWMRQGSSFGFEIFDVISNGPEPKAHASASNRLLRTWRLRGLIRPLDYRRLERLVAAHGGARPVWVCPSLEREPVPAFCGSISSTMEGALKCRVQTEISEA